MLGLVDELRKTSALSRLVLIFLGLLLLGEATLHDQAHLGAAMPSEAILIFVTAFLPLIFHERSKLIIIEIVVSFLIVIAVFLLIHHASNGLFTPGAELTVVSIFIAAYWRGLFTLGKWGAAILMAVVAIANLAHEHHTFAEILSGIFAGFPIWFLCAKRPRGKSLASKKSTEGLGFEVENVQNVAFGTSREFWDRTYGQGAWRFLNSDDQAPRFAQIAQMSSRAGESVADVLDIGCGHATLLRFLPFNCRYTGLDLSEVVTEANRLEFGAREGASFVAADYLHYREGQKFDCIVLNEVLYYFPFWHLSKILAKCHAALKSDDSLLIISMNKNPKALLLWELLSFRSRASRAVVVQNTITNSRWYVQAYQRKDLAL